jgi:hypothetical protein
VAFLPFPGIKNNRQRVASRKDGPPCLGILCPLSFSLVVGGLKLEVRFIVTANGALLGGVLANYDITALQALPDSITIAREDQTTLDVGQQLTIALLVLFLDLANSSKEASQLGESLLFGSLGELGVHVSPLEILALGGI